MSPHELTATTGKSDAAAASAALASPRPAVEIPTLLLILATYGGWLAATFAYRQWPLIVVAPLVTVLITLHGSLQHEIVHGHPTRWRSINRLMGVVPLLVYLPFDRYRASHHAHHIDARLTDPLDDPESYYWTSDDWARLPGFVRSLVRVQQTLAGRVTLGAFWTIGSFLRTELRALRANQDGVRRVWLEHLLWSLPVVAWITLAAGIPLSVYMLTMVVPATSITLIRSYAEHRAVPTVRQRIAIVERSWLLGPLFLFNSLHALHHEAPGVPWYQYPARYRRDRARLIAENGGLVYRSYLDVARRFLFRPHDRLLHPTERVPRAD